MPDWPRIGIGCSRLAAGSLLSTDARIIHAAFETGARHFDVAPQYGGGTAEDVLGLALKDRRNKVTITTKVGIERPVHNSKQLLLRALAEPVRRFLPHRAKNSTEQRQLNFDPSYVERTFIDSLRRLRTDRVDYLFLHMAELTDVTDDLIEILVDLQKKGAVEVLGLATNQSDAESIMATYPEVFAITQHHWNITMPITSSIKPRHFLHGAVTTSLPRILKRFSSNEVFRREAERQTGRDLLQPGVLSSLIVGALMACNPNGIGLVSSRSVRRTVANVVAALSPEYQRDGLALYKIMNRSDGA